MLNQNQRYYLIVSDKIKTGAKGESLAADFLKKKGFEVVARNYRYKKAEIDLIVRRQDWLIFVEVKTRRSIAYGQPEEFVTLGQARKIYDAAEHYIFSANWCGHVRFDVVAILLIDESLPEIQHFEDAIN
jgi:putative endonuclease